MRTKFAAALALIILLAIAGIFVYRQLLRSGKIKFNKYDRRAEGDLNVGDSAPDLRLTMFDGSQIQLSGLWAQKPLFLIFGSCT